MIVKLDKHGQEIAVYSYTWDEELEIAITCLLRHSFQVRRDDEWKVHELADCKIYVTQVRRYVVAKRSYTREELISFSARVRAMKAFL